MRKLLVTLAVVLWASTALAVGGTSSGWAGWARRNWRPKDVTSVALALNLNPDSTQMTLVSSTHISVWADQSGNGRDGSQGTDAVRLIYDATGGPAGSPCVDLSTAGTNVGFGDVFSGLTAAEIFVVRYLAADPPTVGAGAFYSFGSAGTSDHVPFSDGNVYDGFASTVRSATGNPTPSLAGWHVYNVTSTASEWTNRINGIQHFTTGSNTVGWSTTPLLGRSVAAISGTSDKLLTVWMWAGKLSAGDRAAEISWLNRTYALGIALP
jgi:hypothetical protein